MAGLEYKVERYFPLVSVQSVVTLFNYQLGKGEEIDLAFLSIVIGCIEHTLTVNRLPHGSDDVNFTVASFPVLEYKTVEALYCKFRTFIKGNVDLTKFPSSCATRELIKSVSDVIWRSLTRAYYKDRAHLQSLFSFLTGNKLDCFGVAFAVVAACQVLMFRDVRLSLSEDHAWVVFGKSGQETAEVTWHGKGNEDKRGQPISQAMQDRIWLYLSGCPVLCTRQMEAVAIISSINPAISSTVDSVEMGVLQQELLYLFYRKGHVSRYPMALGNLGDLEEINPVAGHPIPEHFYQEGINTARKVYNNQHVYPYTYLGAHHYRHKRYALAIHSWAQASEVIRGYNYTRDDEEVYKEFHEIANEFIPNIVKSAIKTECAMVHELPLLQNPDVYADLLHFYDGICEWEEGSPTPVLHVGWASQFTFSLSKFDPSVRSLLDICASVADDENDESVKVVDAKVANSIMGAPLTRGHRNQREKLKHGSGVVGKVDSLDDSVFEGKGKEKIKMAMEDLVSKKGSVQTEFSVPSPHVTALAQACGSSILNKDFLLGGGEPFSCAQSSFMSSLSDSPEQSLQALSTVSLPGDANGVHCMVDSSGVSGNALIHDDVAAGSWRTNESVSLPAVSQLDPLCSHVSLELRSEKMRGLHRILTSTKLNANAIELQLTAQSQVRLKHGKRNADSDLIHARKRVRR